MKITKFHEKQKFVKITEGHVISTIHFETLNHCRSQVLSKIITSGTFRVRQREVNAKFGHPVRVLN